MTFSFSFSFLVQDCLFTQKAVFWPSFAYRQPDRLVLVCKTKTRNKKQKTKNFAGSKEKLEEMFRAGLNEDQRSAVRKLVTAKDYALLLGMPGTGKRTAGIQPWCTITTGGGRFRFV